jgi:AcrR family transcriptional regulator
MSSAPAQGYDLLEGSTLFPSEGRAQARHALIAAGIGEFGERGVDGASARRFAELAGQNVAAIAYYFGIALSASIGCKTEKLSK